MFLWFLLLGCCIVWTKIKQTSPALNQNLAKALKQAEWNAKSRLSVVIEIVRSKKERKWRNYNQCLFLYFLCLTKHVNIWLHLSTLFKNIQKWCTKAWFAKIEGILFFIKASLQDDDSANFPLYMTCKKGWIFLEIIMRSISGLGR